MKKVKSILSLLLALIIAMGCVSTAFAADAATEDSDNNTLLTADALVVGGSITGAFDAADDVDYFKITTKKAGLLTVSLQHTTNESTLGYFNVEVLDAEEKILASFVSKGNDAKVTSTAFGVAIGDYYVKVTPVTFDRALSYTLSVTEDTTTVAEKEPNDDSSTATAVDEIKGDNTGSKKYAGFISSATDVDYYSLTKKADGSIYFYIFNNANSAGSYKAELVTYFSPSTDEKVLGSITIAPGEARAMSASVGIEGGKTYFLKVTSADGSTGGYEIRFWNYDHKNTEFEYNNEPAAATKLSVSTDKVDNTRVASITHADDVDFFKIETTDKYAYTLKVNAYVDKMTTAAQWKVSVYAADNLTGDAILEAMATDSKAAELSFNNLEAGIYYIKVTAGTDFNTERYEIELTQAEKEEGPKSFIERLKDIKWGTLLGTFAGWFNQIDIAGVVKAIYQSIMGLLGAI